MGKQTFHRPKSVAHDRNRSGSMISSIYDDALQKFNNLHLYSCPRNSERVAGSLKAPMWCMVVVMAFCLLTPRICIQR